MKPITQTAPEIDSKFDAFNNRLRQLTRGTDSFLEQAERDAEVAFNLVHEQRREAGSVTAAPVQVVRPRGITHTQ
jgi:hypothetical protein